MRRGWWVVGAIALSLLCWQAPVLAQSARPAAQARGHKLQQVETEASMVLSGRLHVAADGAITSHEIDDRGSVPASVLKYVDAQVVHWRVEWGAEVDEPAATSLPFSVRLVATPDGGAYRLRIASTLLGEMPGEPAARIRARGPLKPPSYPMGALWGGASGTVYLLVKVNREGKVEDAFVEQVNLNVVAYERVLEGLRRELSNAVLAVAPKWEFDVPTVGPDADDAYWTVRVPADFVIQGRETPYGTWAQYVPGERRYAEWADYSGEGGGIDVGSNGRARLVGTGPRLVHAEPPQG